MSGIVYHHGELETENYAQLDYNILEADVCGS